VYRLAVLLYLVSLVAPTFAHATEYVVTKTADTFDGACNQDCSLREAVLAANSGPGNVVTVPAGLYRLTRAPAATDPENGVTGSLYIERPMTINGAGKDQTIIDARPSNGAQGIDRVLLITGFGSATVTGITLRGGNVASGSPRSLTAGLGGGVYIQRSTTGGAITFVDSAITDNTASNSGGGILIGKAVVDDGEDDLVLIRTDVLRNRTPNDILGQGAGIWNGHANVRIVDSTIDGNISATTGGGILNSVTQSQLNANLTIIGSTISNNIAGLNGSGGAPAIGGVGGGIYNTGGAMDIENSTIVGNEARPGTLPFPSGQGGGVDNLPISTNPQTTRLINCTVAYNVAEVGSQLFATVLPSGSGLLLGNTLIVGAPGGDPNCPVGVPSGIGMVSLGGNISSDTSLCNLNPTQLGDQVGVMDTGLAASLADNGGDTLTLSIPDSGPAAGAGQIVHCPVTDQRGVTRPAVCSVGAYEPIAAPPVGCGDASEAATLVVGTPAGGAPGPFAITATDALIVLRAVVGAAQCPLCVCDVNGSGGITATDALIVLRAAVGVQVPLDCPACA